MQSAWQTGVANARLSFVGKLDFRFLHKNDCLGNIEYFVSFNITSLTSNVLDRTLLYPSTDPLPISFLVV